MNKEEILRNPRILLLLLAILGSIIAVYPHYSDSGLTSRLKYGLDLEGGSWLQLQLVGAITQVEVEEGRIIQHEFSSLLKDPTLAISNVTLDSITFTTTSTPTKKEIDAMGYGSATVSRLGGMTRVKLETTKEEVIRAFLAGKLKAEVLVIPGRITQYEIRGAVTEESLSLLLSSVEGKIVLFRRGLTEETRDLTKKTLEDKLNGLGLKDIPIRTVGENYILIDLAGVDMATARAIAATPGKFEIRIQVQENNTEHILYGDQIRSVGVPEKEKTRAWGVPFRLSDKGAIALRDAAIQHGAVTNPSEHELIMYLDEKEIFSGPLAPELAKNIQSVPVQDLVAQTGSGEEGQKKAQELQIHLRAGALPVNVEVIGSGQVSASLGAQFKSQVAIAGIITLIAVALIIYLRYRKRQIILPMLATSFSEVLIILGFASLIGWQLDLPSITGIIAVLGTGVDHLIIITDEVLTGGAAPTGKTYRIRISKAFAIIFAAAATVLVAMFPLVYLGFGALKGFAVITIVGVLIGVGIARPAYAVIIQEALKEEVPEAIPKRKKARKKET